MLQNLEYLVYFSLLAINWFGCFFIAIFYQKSKKYKIRYGLLMKKLFKPVAILYSLYYIIDILLIKENIIHSIIFSSVIIGIDFIWHLAFYQLGCKWLKIKD